MHQSITFKGIEQAVGNLDYRNPESPKYKLLHAIKAFYRSEEDVERVHAIDMDRLVSAIWDVGDDPALLRGRRKNFHSLKSAVNSDLIELYENGENPEGIVIGPENNFSLSDKAKDNILSTMAGAFREKGNLSLAEIGEILSAVSEALKDLNVPQQDAKGDLARLKNAIQALSRDFGMNTSPIAADAAEGLRVGSQMADGEGAGADEVVELEVPEGEASGDEGEGGESAGGWGGEEAAGELEEIDAEELEALEAVDGEETPEEEESDPLEEVEPDGDLPEDDGLEDAVGGADTPGPGDEDGAGGPPDGEGAGADEVVELEVFEGEASGDEGEGSESAGSRDGGETAGELEGIDAEELEDLEAVDGEDDPEEPEADEDLPDDEDAGQSAAGIEDGGNEDEIIELMEEDALGEEWETEAAEEAPELGLPFEADESEFSLPKAERNRLLSERFDGYLGAMDRYYNQYLEVPAGRYTIGGTAGKNASDERIISLPRYYLGKYPVTNSLFEVFVERTGYKTTAEQKGYGEVHYGRYQKIMDKKSGLMKSFWKATYTRKKVEGAFWYQPFGPGSTLYGKRNHPVVQVSYQDAAAFAAWIGKRLPTAEEWEAAARTLKGNLYPWGVEWMPSLCNIESSAVADTTPVDHYPAGENELGFADLQGNVMEWTRDVADEPEPGCRMVKGGSWISSEDIDLCSRSFVKADTSANILGFRCVAE